MDRDKIGIYVNPGEGTVVRITSPYWLPEEPAWKLVTERSQRYAVGRQAGHHRQGHNAGRLRRGLDQHSRQGIGRHPPPWPSGVVIFFLI